MDPQPVGEQGQQELLVAGPGQVGWDLQVREMSQYSPLTLRRLETHIFTCIVHLIMPPDARDIAETNLFKSMSLKKNLHE